MFGKKTVRDADFDGKTVLLRTDYNIGIKDGKLEDDYRIRMSLPTIEYLLNQKAKVAVISHMGRPGGQKRPELSLEPAAERLSELLAGAEVAFSPFTVGDGVKQAVKNTKPGGIVVLENLRFYPGEEANDAQFAKELAEPADYFVQDGFGVVHRAHASTVAITAFLPSVAGLLVEKEVTAIKNAVDSPQKPFVAIIGGAKISDKIDLIDRLIKQSDALVIGGSMANTFLKAMGYEIGASKYDADETGQAREIIEHCDLAKTKLVLPLADVGVGQEFSASAERRDVPTESVGPKDIIMDIGPASAAEVIAELKSAKTIVWNGPLGVTEFERFKQSTESVARAIAKNRLNCVVGGGDTAGFIHRLGLVDKFTHVSTGGGASLELMSGKKLPGVEALLDK